MKKYQMVLSNGLKFSFDEVIDSSLLEEKFINLNLKGKQYRVNTNHIVLIRELSDNPKEKPKGMIF